MCTNLSSGSWTTDTDRHQSASKGCCRLILIACLQEAGITELLMSPGKLCDVLPGCSGTRNLSDNLSDLQAQVGTSKMSLLPTVTVQCRR
jgi:hypothetical protein